MPLKIYKRKSGLYHLRGTFQGRRVDRSLGTRDKVVADQLRQAAEQEIATTVIHGPDVKRTFEDAALAYMESGKSPRFLKPIITELAGRKISSITRADLDEIAKKHYPRCADSTINRQVYTPAGAVLNFAADLGWRAPIRVKRRPEPKGRTRWLQVEEAERLIEHSGTLSLFITLALESACRTGELLKLDYQDVDLGGQRFQLWDNETKTSRQRVAHFGSRSLSQMAGTNGNVITTRDGKPYKIQPNSGGTISGQFETVCRKAGIEGVTPHILRHTWATWALSIDPNMIRAKEFGGWASVRQLERYAKLAPVGYGKKVQEAGWELFGKA